MHPSNAQKLTLLNKVSKNKTQCSLPAQRRGNSLLISHLNLFHPQHVNWIHQPNISMNTSTHGLPSYLICCQWNQIRQRKSSEISIPEKAQRTFQGNIRHRTSQLPDVSTAQRQWSFWRSILTIKGDSGKPYLVEMAVSLFPSGS